MPTRSRLRVKRQSVDRKQVVYWDSSIYIAYFMDEKRPNGEMDGVYECVDRIRNGQAIVIVGMAVFDEVVSGKYAVKYRKLVNELFASQAFQPVANPRIGELAEELYDHYAKLRAKNGDRALTKKDAEHLAAAINVNVDAFYTFDDGKKKGALGLLGLNGNVMGHKLTICKPPVIQYRLSLGIE